MANTFCDPMKTEDLRGRIIISDSILKKEEEEFKKMRNDSRLRVAWGVMPFISVNEKFLFFL